MDWISVAEAARLLRRSEPHVRRLASSGAVPAHRFGGGWVLNAQAVRARRDRTPVLGRPPSADMTWLLLSTLSRALEHHRSPNRTEPDRLQQVGDRRTRYRIRQLLTGAPPTGQWSTWLRRRAELRRVWMHPGVLERLAADRRLHVGGATAATAAGLGLTSSSPQRFYVRQRDVDAVLAEYRARDDDVDGQVELMVVPTLATDPLPAADSGGPVPAAAGLVDLLDSLDAREHHAAAQLLEAASARLTGAP